jgi:hypothetical protein
MHFDTFALDMNNFLSFAEVNDYLCEAHVGRTSVVGDRRLAIRPGFGRQKKYLTIPAWLDATAGIDTVQTPETLVLPTTAAFPQRPGQGSKSTTIGQSS